MVDLFGTEYYFIGKEDAAYNVYHICFRFEWSSVHTVHLKDISLRAGGSSGAFVNWDKSGGMDSHVGGTITFDIHGTCSIESTNQNAPAAICLSKQTVQFTGDGKLTVTGADGANATAAGGDGTDGRCGLIADQVIVNMTGTLNVYGGNGGNGAKGADRSVWMKASNHPSNDNDRNVEGYAGQNGGSGGNGGDAVQANNVSASVKCNFAFVGGNGGNGAKGGSGGSTQYSWGFLGAGKDSYEFRGGNGGNAGDGGSGTTPGEAGNIGEKGAYGPNAGTARGGQSYKQGVAYDGTPGKRGDTIEICWV